MPRLFGTFGVRGIVNKELTIKTALELGQALATDLGNRGRVALGRDNRTSGEMLELALVAGLNSGGCDVVRLGLTPTPVLSFATRSFGCDAGVMITASHNPAEYNGIKFWDQEGAGFQRWREDRIERIMSHGPKLVGWRDIGRSERVEALPLYFDAILERVPRFRRGLKVVVDCANAVGNLVTPSLLRELGCQVISLNSQLDGTFPGRKLETIPENLNGLAKAVVSCKADLGVAHDGDADRTLVVDERGEVISGDRVFAHVALHYLRGKSRPRILTTVATSSVLDDVAAKLGGEVVRTKVGEPELVEEIRKNGGDIAGEENGGVIFPDWLLCRDGIMTAVQFIAALDSTDMKASELNLTLPKYFQVKRRLECPDEKKAKVLARLTKRFSRYRTSHMDGLRIELEEGWLLLRPSGTEPIFRCFAEAKTEKQAKALAALGMRELKAAIKGS
ncbi:MAG: phosphoglucosamine mutase [Candidatus Hadarchaeum sp.]|uniref:phosphoglucosamine mutase n=1 Tax=Candidatus Hadarchaeum sp. TaxID=2883567 RepID=UPI003D0A8418